ncbi:hypothetical protein DPMN_091546 [Dreissena polymorpha]|uniref:Uncharacterized protein n=1 Tax=Dreissena polymorpha TaxID=45954 RepID=A0A9D4R0T7_DREPO|nr:hypothetical protein DPMN_091546 [Dreissena polymorpha]
MVEYSHHDGIEEPYLYGHASCAGSQAVSQLTEGCLCFTDAGFDICIRSSMVFKNAADIAEAAALVQCLALDCNGCVLEYVGLEHLVLPSV